MEPGLSPLWQSIKKMDSAGVRCGAGRVGLLFAGFTLGFSSIRLAHAVLLCMCSSAVSASADLNERDANGDTPLLYIARAG